MVASFHFFFPSDYFELHCGNMVGRSTHRGPSRTILRSANAASYSFHSSLPVRRLFRLTIFLSISNAANAEINAASFMPVERSKAAYKDARPLERRVQNATCEAGYDWANNAAGISPCVMAAAAFACTTARTGHIIPPLFPASHYDPPSLRNTTVNLMGSIQPDQYVYPLSGRSILVVYVSNVIIPIEYMDLEFTSTFLGGYLTASIRPY
ncbi:hypothetical protein F5880DRAFT_1614247 [Lentinula raphanica]|nr:hypothetical protein F5880DRAFT_1614247 [Lentinula raphanica]